MMEMFKDGKKVAEMDVTGITEEDLEKIKRIQKFQGRAVRYRPRKAFLLDK